MIRIPKILIPVSLVVIIALVVEFSSLLALPSAEYYSTDPVSSDRIETVEMIVRGVKCRGTSEFFIDRIKDTGGIISIKTYAGVNKCVIGYNPDQTDPERLKELIEAPYFHPETKEWMENIFAVVSIEESNTQE
ncbi:MAG: hypothetical protein GF315_11155 [candidate division Zixibacteria bacterium]|nr:hypothetical protein [candidate division Zixibacteria bacterium]